MPLLQHRMGGAGVLQNHDCLHASINVNTSFVFMFVFVDEQGTWGHEDKHMGMGTSLSLLLHQRR